MATSLTFVLWCYNSECNVSFQDFSSSRFLAFWKYQYQSRYNWALLKEGLSVSIANRSQSSETQAAPVFQTMGLSFGQSTQVAHFEWHLYQSLITRHTVSKRDRLWSHNQLHWEVEKPQRGSTLWPTTWGLEGLLAWMDGNLTQRFRPTQAL